MRRLRLLLVAASALCCAGPSLADPPPPPTLSSDYLPISTVMQELSKDPAFVDGLLEKLGRDPRAGGILGPENIQRLRELIFGKNWEALDRFPGITVAGMGRAVSLAAVALGKAEAKSPAAPLAADLEEPLGLPTGGPPLAPDTFMKRLRPDLEVGDRVDPDRGAHHADSQRLADLLNRLALNPPPGAPGARFRVRLGDDRAESPRELMALLVRHGASLEVRDARYFANFADLIYQGRDVLTPFWLDTEIRVPGRDWTLLVPAGHSQHEVLVRGPLVNADLAFFFGIDGEAVLRTNDTRDQAWTLGYAPHVYQGDDALEAMRLLGEIIRRYDAIHRARPDLPFGGYYALGVCNDVNAILELHMQGSTTLYPLTHDKALFQGDDEVSRLVARLPVDGRGARVDAARVRGSLPAASIDAIPESRLRDDLVRVGGAWRLGELRYARSSWWWWIGAGLAALVLGAALLLRRLRARAA